MILKYNEELVNKMGFVVRDAGKKYEKFLLINKNVDNINLLSDLLNNECKDYLDEVSFVVDDSKSENDCFDWFFATVNIVDGKPNIKFYLNKDVLTGTWTFEQFEYEILTCFCHETIHLEQYKKVPFNVLKNMSTSYSNVPDEKFWVSYHSDPFEIMAYAHNLYVELENSTNKEKALKNPEKYLEELPTYFTYRRLFKKNNKIIKRLLKYTYQYVEACHGK